MAEARWSLHFSWGRAPYALDLPEVVIGRGDACTLQIADEDAAEEHARFIIDENEQVWLEDLGSGRPTLINGRAINTRSQLGDGDFVQIGHAVLTLRVSATAAPVVTAAPDARTIGMTNLPDEVRRLLAERDSEAKNFVVGQEQPHALATLMMESPLIPPSAAPGPSGRDPQRTIEVNAADVLASIPRDPAPPSAPQPDAPRTATPAQATIRMDAVPQPHGPMMTLHGIGPQEIAASPTMIAPGVQPTGATNLAAAPTAIAQAPSRPRSQSQADITPLPAPLPPPQSIPDLRDLVAQMGPPSGGFVDDESTRADKKAARETTPAPATINSMVTHQLDVGEPGNIATDKTQLPQRVPSEVLSLHSQKTALPTQLPAEVQSLHSQKTALPTQLPAEVQSLHNRETQLGTPMPENVAAIKAQRAAQTTTPPQGTIPPTATLPHVNKSKGEYIPPKKGLFGSFSRAIDFFQQMFALAKDEPALRSPIKANIMMATPVMIGVSALLFVLRSGGAVYTVMSLGVAALYFIDYFCNARTASLMFDYVTTGKVDLPNAKARVKKSLQGIMLFAAVSALLDVATTYARERNDLVSKILLRILHSIWTTATYWIMPAMVIEGVPFKEAFARSKKLMDQDPTGVGAGVVALSLVSYLCAAIIFPLAFTFERLGAHIHPAVGMVLFFTMVNTYWAVSGWLKIAYSTCFYMWAKQCEIAGKTDHALAPLPLRHALDAG